MAVIAFFNNKGGVGKTSLVYHLAWMYWDLGFRVLAADLDPQANLTAAFLTEERLEELWPEGEHRETILGAVQPILRGTGDIAEPHVEKVEDGLGLIVGDLGLSAFEDPLSYNWPLCLDGRESAFRTVSAFHRVLSRATVATGATVVLVDVGPNLGAINRAAIIGASHIVMPLAPDLFSLQGLRNLGPTLRQWRKEWASRLERNPVPDLSLPSADMKPAGYVILQHAVRLDRPVQAYDRWMARIPSYYRSEILDEPAEGVMSVLEDRNCLALLKHYRSLMPLAQDAHRPMFYLKPADGALGAHVYAVSRCYEDFRQLAHRVAQATGAKVALLED